MLPKRFVILVSSPDYKYAISPFPHGTAKVLGNYFESDDRGYQGEYEEYAPECSGFVENEDSHQYCPDSSDTRPYGVGCPDGEVLRGFGQ